MEKIIGIFNKYYNKKILLGPSQALIISQVILNKNQNCNMLVFGCGNDSTLWQNMNYNGYTLFLETSSAWKYSCLKENPNLNIELYNVGNNNVKRSLLDDIDEIQIPDFIKNIQWDIIFIDGPEGFSPDKPGRAIPILWANKIKNSKTHIFVDDYERTLEKKFTDEYINPNCILIDRNRHFKVSQLAWFNPDIKILV